MTKDIENKLKLAENNYRKLFGALMRLKRVQKHLTHEQITTQSRISRPTLSKVESAKEQTTKRTFDRVSMALGISDNERELLTSFSKIYDPDDGIRILVSCEFIEALGNIKVAEIFEQARDIAAKTPDTSITAQMFDRTALVIAIMGHHDRLPKCKPSWN